MKLELLAKKNQDLSYSVSIRASDLVHHSFVDFYDDKTGQGYQRRETLRDRRGREIAQYIERCIKQNLPPRLFEMTANAREAKKVTFDPLDEKDRLGILYINNPTERFFSIIDGGTRLLGIQNALSQSIIDEETTFDVRLFVDLTVAEEVAQFLLINEKQKRVRTDLSLRLVQKLLDNGDLQDNEMHVLETVVPKTDSWRYEASRIAGLMNKHSDSPWNNLIQMPGDNSPKPVKLQAFFSSLKNVLTEPDLEKHFERVARQLEFNSKSEVIAQILRNYWNAVRSVNPKAHEEPNTNVLWGSIGVNASHIALSTILLSIFNSQDVDFTQDRFERILKDTMIADYPKWFTKPGTKDEKEYPGEKGEFPTMTGAANYVRLAKMLEDDVRIAIHADMHAGNVKI